MAALAAPVRAAEAPAKGGAKVAVSATADLVTAENAHLRIEFSRKDGVIRLAKLVNKSDKRSVLEDAGPLWRAETDKGNSAGDASAKAASLAAKELPGGGARLTLRWEGAGGGALDVEVTVDVAPGSRETLWRIQPAAADKNAAIKRVDFPLFEGVGRGGKWDRLVRPHLANPRALNPESLAESRLLYPTGSGQTSSSMQFAIYEFAAPGCTKRQEDDQKQIGGGLYVAAYDPLCLVKEFFSKGLGEGKGTSLAISHFGEGLVTEKDGKPGLGFPCAVGVFDGGYWGGLDLYRDWARAQAWCAAGPIRKRTDFPKRLLGCSIINPFAFDPSQKVLDRFKGKYDRFEDLKFEEFADEEKASLVPLALTNAKEFIEKFSNTPSCLQWYRWHIQPFDYAYPDYFPIRPGWLEACAQMEKAYPGHFVHMPYINGRAVASHSELWTKNRGLVDKYTTGGHERYGVTDFAVMCPATEFWQNLMVDLTARIFRETKCDGLYVDQLGADTPALRCTRDGHGHTPGDPGSPVRGYRAMLQKMRAEAKKINPDAFLTTEFFSEPLVGLCDGFLTWGSKELSLTAYVYGEHAVLFGHGRTAPIDEQYTRMDCAMVADEFVAGAALGWMMTQDPNPHAYIKKLAPLRAKVASYLRLPMVKPITGTQTDHFWTSLRKGDNGEAVVIATNPQTNDTLTETYELDCQAAGLKPGKYRLKAITMDGDKDLGPQEVAGDVFKFQVKLEPFEAAVYVLAPLAAKGK